MMILAIIVMLVSLVYGIVLIKMAVDDGTDSAYYLLGTGAGVLIIYGFGGGVLALINELIL